MNNNLSTQQRSVELAIHPSKGLTATFTDERDVLVIRATILILLTILAGACTYKVLKTIK